MKTVSKSEKRLILIKHYGRDVLISGVLALFFALLLRNELLEPELIIALAFFLGLYIGLFYVLIFSRIRFKSYRFALGDFLSRMLLIAGTLLSFMVPLAIWVDPLDTLQNTGSEDPILFQLFSQERFRVAVGKALSVSVLLILYQEIKNHLGVTNPLVLISGKYQKPRPENRIFLFLDLKGSTTLTERLGNEKYFDFLNSFLKDMSKPILYSHATIYQYVGDEVVLTWKVKDQNSNQLPFIFLTEFAAVLKDRTNWYQERFGAVPRYRVGLHAGSAVTAQVGEVKKSLVFSGDVLNTTSRIMGLCKPLGTDLLFSSVIAHGLDEQIRGTLVDHGIQEIRGKQEGMRVYSFANS